MVGGLLDRLFGGRPSEIICHHLEGGEIDDDELTRVKELISQRERDRGDVR